MVCRIGEHLFNLIVCLLPKMLTPHLSRLAQKCKQGDYCYANAPEKKIAASSNDMPLS